MRIVSATLLLGLAGLLVALTAGPQLVPAADAVRVSGVALTFVGRELRVDARLDPALPPDVAERAASGLPTTTVWEIRLCRDRDVVWDGVKDERRYDVTASYRPVSSDWVVERRLDGKLLETRTVAVLADATAALSSVRDLPAFIMGRHLIGQRLYVKVRGTYGTDLVLGILPSSRTTGWARSERFTWTGDGP